jgi:hypothetical protein
MLERPGKRLVMRCREKIIAQFLFSLWRFRIKFLQEFFSALRGVFVDESIGHRRAQQHGRAHHERRNFQHGQHRRFFQARLELLVIDLFAFFQVGHEGSADIQKGCGIAPLEGNIHMAIIPKGEGNIISTGDDGGMQ